MNKVIQSLATQIKSEHSLVKEAGQRFIEHAMKCGDLLAEAKSQVEHGQWLPWLEKECGINQRTAQRYMRAAKHKLEIEAKTDAVSDLTLTGALKIIEQEPPPTPLRVSMTDPKNRRLALIRSARDKARELYDLYGWRIKIDVAPQIRIEECGAWVSCWFWVPRHDEQELNLNINQRSQS